MVFNYSYLFHHVERQHLNYLRHSLIKDARVKAYEVSNVVEAKLSTLQAIASHDIVKNSQVARYDELISFFDDDVLDDVIIVDRRGQSQHSERQYSAAEDKFFAENLAGRVAMSHLKYDAPSDTYYILISVPILRNQYVAGAVIGYISAYQLSEIINQNLPYQESYAYIIDTDQHTLAHKNLSSLREDTCINEIVRQTERFSGLLSFVNWSMVKETGLGSYQRDSQSQLVAFSQIDKTAWRIYISTKREIALASFQRIKLMHVMISFIALLMGLLASVLIANRIAKPIINLSEKLNRASQGHLDTRSTYRADDEIGLLAQSFNKLMDKINQLSFFDALTKLPNSNILIQDIKQKIHSDNDETDTLVLISIDKFTKINEIHGFKVGDVILRQIAWRLDQTIDGKDSLYKGRGDEFFIILKNCTRAQAERSVEKISNALLKPYAHEYHTILLKLSVGLISYNGNQYTANQLINNVTHANILSKSDPKNRWSWYSANTHQLDRHYADLENQLYNAIKNRELYLAYQPIVDLASEEVVEAEVLIRWHNAKHGAVPTEEFIQIAEDNGYIYTIDQWVFENACRQLIAWQNKIMLSVNISATTFESDRFVDFVKTTINSYQVSPECLQIELTERLLLNNPAASIAKMHTLQDFGIRIALDDFGVGYSSLSYLVKFPINLVKIDRSFIKSMHTDTHATAIVNAIINMCQELNLAVLAEGVENIAEVSYLKQKKCAYSQGYYYSKPLKHMDFYEKYIRLEGIHHG